MVNHIGIYGSKAAEGLSAFQRRSCAYYFHLHPLYIGRGLFVGIDINFYQL